MQVSRGHVVVLSLLLASLAACGEVAPPAADAAIDAPIDAPIDTPSDVTLTVALAGTATGHVTSAPAGIDCGATCTMTTAPGTVVTLSAAPDVGASFAGWTGGGCSGTGTCAVTLTAATTVTATFNTARYTVTLNLMGNGGGNVTSTPSGISCPGTCTTTVAHGTVVTLAQTPDASSTFVGWGGSCVGTGPCSVTVTADTTVSASFALNSSLIVAKNGTGTGTVTSSPAGINCGVDCSEAYTPGTIVTLTATPAVGSTFTGWSGGGCTGTGVCTITLNAAQMVTATFTLNSYTLTAAKAGTGTGTVTSTPAGINCGTDCAEVYAHGTVVVLNAAAAAGSSFTGWSGGGCSGTGNCVVTLTAATTVTATFSLQQFTLTVSRAGTGTGTVTSSPAGISCGTDCTEVYGSGTIVVLTATPAAGSTFTGWSGGGCSGNGTCSVTISAAVSVTATFTLQQFTLTAARAGTGTGTITSNPAGINCGTDCTEVYNAGTVVVLTAAAAVGSTFTGWSGGGCSGTGTCTVTMNAAVSVSATFGPGPIVVSAGWNCGSGVSCTDLYDFTLGANTTVTFSVTAVTGSSVLRLGAYNPGVAYSGANLLTGPAADRKCVGQNASDTVLFQAVTAGTYRLSVGRDWGSSAGASGTYTLQVTSTGAITYLGTSNNDVVEGTTTFRCGYTATFSSGWACASGVSCQDTYSFDSLVATPATVAASAITGSSVVRLAVFNGTTVTTTNQLNGMLTDRKCVGQNIGDTANTTGSLPAGGHLFSVGRDWGSSAGASGTYTYVITTPNAPLVPRGQVTNDTGSAFATTTCP